MKSYIFATDEGRGGVVLCDQPTLEEVVPYLTKRFKGIVRVEEGLRVWTPEGGFSTFEPTPVSASAVE